jgi:hypothetical protein
MAISVMSTQVDIVAARPTGAISIAGQARFQSPAHSIIDTQK